MSYRARGLVATGVRPHDSAPLDGSLLPGAAQPGSRPIYGIRLFGESASRIAVRERDRWIWVELASIVQVVADDDYVVIHAQRRRHMVYIRLGELLQRYPHHFVQVSRSRLVGVAHVLWLGRFPGRRVALGLSDGSTVVASRRLSSSVKRALAGVPGRSGSGTDVPVTEGP